MFADCVYLPLVFFLGGISFSASTRFPFCFGSLCSVQVSRSPAALDKKGLTDFMSLPGTHLRTQFKAVIQRQKCSPFPFKLLILLPHSKLVPGSLILLAYVTPVSFSSRLYSHELPRPFFRNSLSVFPLLTVSSSAIAMKQMLVTSPSLEKLKC